MAQLANRVQQTLTTPRQAPVVPDLKAIKQRERQMAWRRNQQQILALAVIVSVVFVGAICRYLYYLNAFSFLTRR